MSRKEFFKFLKGIRYLSDNDKLRLLQCLYCVHDPGVCGCTEDDEDEQGMCKYYRMDVRRK